MDFKALKIEPGDTIVIKVGKDDVMDEILSTYHSALEMFPENNVICSFAENIVIQKGE